MQARSISPPPVASRTMAATSVMIEPVEIDFAGKAAQLDAPLAWNLHRDRRTPPGREDIGAAPDLNHCARRGRVLQPRRAAARQKAERVARVHDPSAGIEETLHLKFVRVERTAAMDHVRVFEFDAIAGTAPDDEKGGHQEDHDGRMQRAPRAK